MKRQSFTRRDDAVNDEFWAWYFRELVPQVREKLEIVVAKETEIWEKEHGDR